jgi:1,4-dihydroxy-2-naphthoate octaprenyltransferase
VTATNTGTSLGADRPRPRLGTHLRSLRLFSLPVSVLPVLVATAAVLPIRDWRWDVLAACVIGAGCLHLVGNLLNDYFDFRSGVDRRVTDDEGRPGRLLVRGELLPGDVLKEAAVCLAPALAATAYLVWRCGGAILCFGAAAGLALYAYTGPPLQLKYRGMGEPLIFLTFGPALMVGAAFAQTGRLEWVVLLLSVMVGLATTAIVVGNSVRDLEEDRQARIVTIGRFAGGRVARALYVILVSACVLGLAGMAAAGAVNWELSLAPLLLGMLHKPIACVWRGRRLPDIDARTAGFETVLLLLLLADFVIRGVAR